MRSRLFIEARGGIGNQLFTYAAANHVSNKYRLPVGIFLSDNHHVNSSIYRLKLENKQINIFTRKTISLSSLVLFFIRIFKKMRVNSSLVSFYDFNKMRPLEEQEIETIILASTQKDYFYFVGYFADMKYLNTQLVDELNSKLEKIVEIDGKFDLKFLESNSISLHIRAGDYLLNPDHYGILGKDYYRNAIAYITALYPGLQVRVWSDDHTFAKSLLIELHAEFDVLFMDAAELKDPILSLYCMSKSGFHILSLSTFSYWSAILAKETAVIIYPSHNRKLIPYVDNVPKTWISMVPEWYANDRN